MDRTAASVPSFAEAPAPAAAMPAVLPSLVATRQDSASRFALGPEVQVYPAGVIAALDVQHVISEHDTLILRLGYNSTDRQDFGRHQSEEGGGPGFGVGYRRYFGPDLGGWLLGGRLDLWFLEIDWMDNAGLPTQRSGTTDVTVLQPTIEGGYGFRLGKSLRLDLTLAFGAEINVHTSGADVGEGGILLGGATLWWGF